MIKYFSYNKRILIGLTVIVSLLISAQISYLKAENPESAKTQQEISSVVLLVTLVHQAKAWLEYQWNNYYVSSVRIPLA